MKITWTRAALLFGGLLVLGAAGLLSGIVPIKASAGHWTVTEWFLQFGKERSVGMRSLPVEVPDLNDPALVVRGAAHYEIGCAPCHGAPGRGPSNVVLATTPPPPLLEETLPAWRDRELFYIVLHGIKLTGMPAWPALEREDEVWATVAFLRVMSQMDPSAYRRLAYGETPSAETPEPQEDPEVREAVEPEEDPSMPDVDVTSFPLGSPLAVTVATCTRCHGPEGRARGWGSFPSLAGQRPEYLERTLRAFAGGTRNSGTMETVASELDEETMGALASYFAERGAGDGRLLTSPPDPEQVAILREAGVRTEPLEAIEGRGTPGVVEDDGDGNDGAAEAAPVAGPEPSAGSVAAGSPSRGARLATQGDRERKIPSCVQCHGPGETPRNPSYPVLAGQYPRYLLDQLRLLRERRRGGTEYLELMHTVVRTLDDREIEDLAAYFASLGEGP